MLRLSSAPLSALRRSNTRLINSARRGFPIQGGMKNRLAALSSCSSRAYIGRIWTEIKYAQLLEKQYQILSTSVAPFLQWDVHAGYFAFSCKVII